MSSTDSAQRYVAGRMDEDEEQRFEESMLEHPDLAAAVEAHQRIKAGLQHLEKQGELSPLLQSSKPSAFKYVRYGAAAAVLLVLAAGVTYWRTAAPPAFLLASSPGSGVAATYLLASTRARPDQTVVQVSRSAGLVRLQVVPDSGVERAYTASLARLSGAQEEVLAQGVPVQAEGSLINVYLDPASLEAGQYQLTLSATGGVSYDYTFNVE